MGFSRALRVVTGGRSASAPGLAILRPWLGRGVWAVADQAFFAGSNFLVGVLLARWLEPGAYGAFATAYAVFLLLGTLHTALWTEPLLVYGSGRFSDRFGAYQDIVLAYHWRFGALVAAFFAALALALRLLGHAELALSFLGLASAAPLILYLWLVRRSAYVHLQPKLAAYGGALYLVVFLGGATALLRAGWLNEGSALVAMGLAALAAGRCIRLLVSERGTGFAAADPADVRALHWNYGRWALAAGALSWVPGNVYFVVLPAFGGLEAAAKLRALMNVVMPVLHFNGAVAGLFVPAFVRATARGTLLHSALGALGVQLAPALAYWLLLMLGGDPITGWLYGGKYDSAGLAMLGSLGVAAAVTGPFGAVLRAVERPDHVARVYGITALASLTAGVGLVYAAGLAGAMAAIIGINFISALSFALLGIRWGKKACA